MKQNVTLNSPNERKSPKSFISPDPISTMRRSIAKNTHQSAISKLLNCNLGRYLQFDRY
jgi:hypothetical protein